MAFVIAIELAYPAGKRSSLAEKVSRNFAVHRNVDPIGMRWSLTHLATGYRVATLSRKVDAKRLARAFEDVLDWSLVKSDIDLKSKRVAFRAILAGFPDSDWIKGSS